GSSAVRLAMQPFGLRPTWRSGYCAALPTPAFSCKIRSAGMFETPRVSVILPHLNEPDLLACLRSLDQQRIDAPPFEIIVVDNGSTVLPERTVSLVAGARLLYQPIPGPGPARNLGALNAKAPLLLFIDAD